MPLKIISNEIKKLTRERDEARQSLSLFVKTRKQLEKLREQRDELAAALEVLKERISWKDHAINCALLLRGEPCNCKVSTAINALQKSNHAAILAERDARIRKEIINSLQKQQVDGNEVQNHPRSSQKMYENQE